jgi:predicted acyltransferase (DUF342 family)
MNLMKFSKGFFVIKLLSVVSISQAALPPELNSPLDNLIIYSGGAITMGEFSAVGGSIIAGVAVTLGASAQVSGSVAARDAGTIGADSTIGGKYH